MPLFLYIPVDNHQPSFYVDTGQQNCPATNNRRSNYERETGTHQGGNIRLRMQ